jgi:hypothetical protein
MSQSILVFYMLLEPNEQASASLHACVNAGQTQDPEPVGLIVAVPAPAPKPAPPSPPHIAGLVNETAMSPSQRLAMVRNMTAQATAIVQNITHPPPLPPVVLSSVPAPPAPLPPIAPSTVTDTKTAVQVRFALRTASTHSYAA